MHLDYTLHQRATHLWDVKVAVLTAELSGFFLVLCHFQTKVRKHVAGLASSEKAHALLGDNSFITSAREDCCDVCYELFSDCHQKQFSAYCFMSTKRQTKTFPEAMVFDAVQLYYIKKYNSALRFVLHEKTGEVHEDEFKLPPECLQIDYSRVMEAAATTHNRHVRKLEHFEDKVQKNASMEYDGIDFVG